MEVSNCEPKYRFLILGGCGFVGRHLVDYLVNNKLAKKVRIVDKMPPQLAWLSQRHKEIFSNEIVEFKSANLINQISCQNAFNDNQEFDFVINLAAETRWGQEDAVYHEGVLKLSLNCAKEAARKGIKFIELSSGQLCSSENDEIRESITNINPWTSIAKYKYKVEQELAKIPDLNYVILRPAIIYGVDDKQGLTPRLTMGAIYKHLNEEMKLLWTKDLKMNTVNVLDVCRAIWFVCNRNDIASGEMFHIVDNSKSTQGSITELISDIFNIKYDYWGKTMSLMACKTNVSELIDDINDKHMSAWSEICSKFNIKNTPINPYLYQELLQEKHLNLNGDKLENFGFKYEVPLLNKESLVQMIESYVLMGLFPDFK